ncbi:MAG: response regulator [Acidobacteria bacterium]|nr:response regulator [Acidobacteriota bacterium]MBK8147039.1 response regulator [Acidobacteriota bacterium]MBK8812405.1 response regulator [Acidobacteriota bacterium]
MEKLILIVEDYEDSRDVLRFLLESCGYFVIEAADGIEAVDKVRRFHPDLILMDISLPVVDGLTATRAIREVTFGSRVPIIAVTAFGSDFKREASEAGCDELLDKPLDYRILKPMLRQYLEC